jgi:GNAT superfamily N-acetyltransferase
MLAPAIKEAGFDGYIALENPEEETYGLFGDLVGREDSMATPIRANSSGKNVKFMPGNASGDQAMAGSSQVDPGLAEVTAPSVDGGPLSGARFMPGMFGITARAFSRPKKVVVPNQKRLDDLKKRLPEYEVDVSEPDGDSVVMVKLFLPGTGKKRKEIGFAKLHLEPYNEEGDSIEDSIRILMTIVGPNYRNKGYGEALYREIAKVAQKYKKEFLYSDEVSTKAAKVRLKLFKEPKYANLLEPGEMLSLVGPRARYMPAARRKKQKEIEFVRPRTFGGPFVEIDGTEPNLDSSTRLDMEDAVMMRKPKNRKAPSANLVGYPMAAAMLVDGKIYSGVNHLDAVFRAANNGAFGDQFKDVWETHFDFSDDFYDEDSDFNVVWNKMANRSVKKGGSQIFVDGFVTDKGYYVSRDVATKLERKNPDSEFDESGEDELHGGHLSGHFMPGYNPRYTDDNGNFDRDAWLNDRRRAEAELRRRGVYKSDLSEEDYENEVRALLREMR